MYPHQNDTESNELRAIDGALAELETLFDRAVPPDADFPCAFSFAGVHALGRKDEKSGQGSVDRTWLPNLQTVCELAGRPKFYDACVTVPKGAKLPKITRIGFIALKDLGQYCDRAVVLLDLDGQIVRDENGTPKTKKNAAKMDLATYANDVLRLRLDSVYGRPVADDVTETEVEVEVEADDIYRPQRIESTDSNAMTRSVAGLQRRFAATGSTFDAVLAGATDALTTTNAYGDLLDGEIGRETALVAKKTEQIARAKLTLLDEYRRLRIDEAKADLLAVKHQIDAEVEAAQVGELSKLIQRMTTEG
jgi:hypothetical protein